MLATLRSSRGMGFRGPDPDADAMEAAEPPSSPSPLPAASALDLMV